MLLSFLLCSVALRARSRAVRSIYKTSDDFRLHIQSHTAVALHSCLCPVCQTWSDNSTLSMLTTTLLSLSISISAAHGLTACFRLPYGTSMAPTHRCARTTMLNCGTHALIALLTVHIRICTCSLRTLNGKNVLSA